jgi:hypothetical protein
VNEVDVGFSNFSIPIPETPDMVWTSASVGVKNMFVDKAPITFSGSLGFAFGPQISGQYIANVTFSGSGSTQQLTAGYDLQMVPFAFANSIGNFGLGDLSSFQSLFPLLKSTGTVTANFAQGGFKDLTFDGGLCQRRRAHQCRRQRRANPHAGRRQRRPDPHHLRGPRQRRPRNPERWRGQGLVRRHRDRRLHPQ